MTTHPTDAKKLARLLLDVAAIAGEPAPTSQSAALDEDFVKNVVRSVLADCGVDTLPYSYSVQGAMAAFGLSKTRIHDLIRDEVVAVRQEGVKLLIIGSSLRSYIDSLPPRGLR